MSTLIFVPVSRKSGTATSAPVSTVAGLVPPGRAVALQARLGVGDLEDHRGRQLDEQHVALVAGDDDLLVLEEELRGVADGLGAHRDLVVGVTVHEDEVGAVVVEVLHVPLVDARGLDLHPGVEGLVDDLAAHDVLQLGAHERRALAGLDVLELHDGPELALEVEDEAVLEVVGRCHGWFFAFVDAGVPPARTRARGTPARGWGSGRSYRDRHRAPAPAAGHTPIVRFATKPLPASPVTVASWWMPPSSPKTLSRVNEVRARFDVLDG